MGVLNKFIKIQTDLEPLGLIHGRNKDFPRYCCTPIDSIIFANTGMDGEHFCVVPEEKSDNHDDSPVWAIFPMYFDTGVNIVSKDFLQFLTFIISTGDAGILGDIQNWSCDEFVKECNKMSKDPEAQDAINTLKSLFSIKKQDPASIYNYIKELQSNADLSSLKFPEEYYE